MEPLHSTHKPGECLSVQEFDQGVSGSENEIGSRPTIDPKQFVHGWKGGDSRLVAKPTSNIYNQMRPLPSYLIEAALPVVCLMKMAEVTYDMSSNGIQSFYSLFILIPDGSC
jgi:hypothetical protein